MKNSRTSKSSRIVGTFLKKCFSVLIASSFILPVNPAFASREDRLDWTHLTRGDRHERRGENRGGNGPRNGFSSGGIVRAADGPTFTTGTPPADFGKGRHGGKHVPKRPEYLPKPVQPKFTIQPIAAPNLISRKHDTLGQPRLPGKLLTSAKTVQTVDAKTKNVDKGLNLDLSSSHDSILLGEKLFSEAGASSVTIKVGSAEETFSAGSKVSAAEYASILQTLGGSGQSLVLDDKGRASAGSINFETLTANGDNMRVTELVIPEQVEAVGNFSRNSDLKLRGDLVNYGSIFAVSNRDGGTRASIATKNLTNADSGLISSYGNRSLGSDLAPSVDLKLHADDTLSNSGRIESSGDLTLSAGGSLVNGSERARATSSASVSAAGNITLDAPEIRNSGSISTETGNVNIVNTQTTPAHINVNGEFGTISAVNGDITVGDINATDKINTTLFSGDWYSKNLKMYSGDGTLEARIGNTTGDIYARAGIAHINALSPNLIIKELVTTGDPTISDPIGSVTLSTDISTTGGPLAVIAFGDIIIDPDVDISTANGAGAGGNILMVAGANFEDATNPGHVGQDWILGGATNGGNITGFTNNTITSDGSTNAGSIQLIAFEAAAGGNGDILLSGTTISSQGGAGASNGDVTAIGRSVDVNNIDASGTGTTATGNVSLNSFTPTITGGSEVRVDDASGAIIAGFGVFSIGAAPVTAGNVTTRNIQAGGSLGIRSSLDVVMLDAVTSASASITSSGSAFFAEDWSLTAPGGASIVAGGSILTAFFGEPTGPRFIDTSSTTGAGGNISIVAGAAFTENGTQITVNGNSATGGFIDLSFFPLTNLRSSSTNGAGGNITIAAFDGSGGGAGDVVITSTNPIATSGSGANANGNVTIVSGSASGFFGVSAINASGGQAGTGDVTLTSSVPAGTPVTITKSNASASGNFTGGASANGTINAGSITAGDDITVNGGFVSVGSLTGSTTLTAANLNATNNLQLNTTTVNSLSASTTGNLELFGDLTARGGIALVAGGEIFLQTAGLDISTANSAGNGGDLVVVAGAAFNQDATSITITGASATGGAVDFDFNDPLTIDTRSSFLNGSGGDITFASFFGSNNSGFIYTDFGTAITSGGNGTGANGNFTAVAGRTSGNGLGILGDLNTTGGSTADTGNVFLSNATPNTGAVIQRSNATFTGGFTGGTAVAATLETQGTITVNNADITLQAGADAFLNDFVGGAGSAFFLTANNLPDIGSVNMSSGSISIVSNLDIVPTGNLTASGGILMVAGRDIFPFASGLTISTASAVGDAGDLTVIAGAAFTQNATTVTITGASATGGAIDFDFNDLDTINSRSTAAGGDGGDMTFVAYRGSLNTGFILTNPVATNITTGGTGAGTNGTFTAVAGGNTGFDTVSIRGNLNTTGGAVNTGDVVLATRTPNSGIAVQKSNATYGGTFLGGAVQSGNVVVDNVTVANGADISLTAGNNIIADNLLGGANSVLTMNSTNVTVLNTQTTLGTANITAGTNFQGGQFNQGATGILNLTTTTGFATIGTINSGSVNLVSGDDLNLTSTVTAATLFSAVADNNINLSDDITSPNGIVLVAGRNISPTVSNVVDLSTASATTNAGNITIIAGAAFTNAANTVTITGASATGGFIDFDFNALRTINARSTALNGNGGNVTMVAFRGSDDTGFVFTDPTQSVITTGGSGTGTNGTFIAVGSNDSGDGVGIRGTLDTTGGAAGTGSVFISTSTPVTTPTNPVIQKASGLVSAGDFRGGALAASNLFVDDITVANGAQINIRSGASAFADDLVGGTNSQVTINASGDVLVNSITQGAGSTTTVNAGGAGTFGPISSGAIALSTGQTLDLAAITGTSFAGVSALDITLSDNLTFPGGILLVAGRNILPFAGGLSISSASAVGDAGDITIIAGAAFSQTPTTVTVTGASTTGGAIDFDFNDLNTINSRSTAAGGDGGDITMVAYRGSLNTGFILTNPVATNITTGGTGAGTNGTFTAIAGGNTGFDTVSIRGNLNTTGGAAGTGDVILATSTPSSGIILQKADATYGGTFAGGAVQSGNVFVDNVTVANGADISMTAGNNIFADNLLGGATSVLTMNAANVIGLTTQATLGTANVTAGTNFSGGNFIQGAAGTLNLTSTTGFTTVGTINSGTVNIVSGDDLNFLGTVTGAVSFSGVASNNINIADDITSPGGIVLVSGHNIAPSAVNVVDLSTASATANAGNITIVAGAAFTNAANTVTITGASATGGFIDFDGNDLRTIDSRSTALNGNGGNVTMVAFNGSDDTGFVFTDPTQSVITTGGSGTGTNGTFIAIGSSDSFDGVGIRGTLNTTGGLASTGSVFISTSTPVTAPTNPVIQKASGLISSGDFRNGALATSNVFVDNITVGNGAQIDIRSGADVVAFDLAGGINSQLNINANGNVQINSNTLGIATITAGGNFVANGAINQGAGATLTVNAAGAGTFNGAINSGTIALSTGQSLALNNTVTASASFAGVSALDITVANDITAPGGILLVAGRNIAPTAAGVVDLSTASNTTNAGDITIVAGAAFGQTPGTVTVNGASATGGLIDFDFVPLLSINARSTALNGSGGDVTLVAFRGSDDTGFVFTDTAGTILTGGSGTGTNGNFTAIGSADSFAGVGIRGTLDTTGGTAGTGDVFIATAVPVAPVTIQKASASITAGNFSGGALATSDVFLDTVIVNGADITINSGANVFAGTFTAGPTGVLTITAGGDTSVDQISTGIVAIQTGGNLLLTDTVTAAINISAVANGDIGFANDLTAPGGLLLVAGHNIFTNSVADLSTASASANGGDITIVAGAAFTQNAGSVTVTGASTTGGFIDFDFNAVQTIDSSSTVLNGSGGDVTMVAFAGTDNTGFVFTDPVTDITTGGSGTGSNGDFTAIAGMTAAGAGIGIRGPVDTTGGSAAGTGNVHIATATPVTTPNVLLSKVNASIISGDFRGGTITNSNLFADGGITVGAGASINIQTGGFAVLGDLTGGAASNVRVRAGNSIDVNAVTTGGSIAMTSGAFSRFNGNLTAPGGILIVAGTDIGPGANNLNVSTASNTGDAGNIMFVAGAAFTQTATDVTITGGSATGGRIDLDGNNLQTLNASSTFAGGDAGDITLVSYFGTANTGEVFTDANTVITANGNGAGSNGNITMVSGKTNGASGIFINGDITVGGGAQGTGSIVLATTTPGSPVTVAKADASIISGSFLGGAAASSDINAGNLTVRGGLIDINSGNHITLGNLNVSGNVNGDGGTIDITTRGTDSLVLGAVSGFNSVAGLNAAGGTTSGDGGAILVTSTSAGGITVSGALPVNATEGDGGDVSLVATAGDITFGAGFSTILANAGTNTATAHDGGTITLQANNVVATGNVNLQANSVAGGNGGLVNVTTNSANDLVIGTTVGAFQISANGPGGEINVIANGGGDVIVSNTGTLNASDVSVVSQSGAIVVTGTINGTTTVDLNVSGTNTISGAGTVSGGTLTINAGTGAASLTTNVANLTVNTNGNVSITETDDLNLNAGTTGNGLLAINVTGDDLNIAGSVTANGGFNLQTSGTGTITGAGTLTSTGQLSVTGGAGAITLTTDIASLAGNSAGTVTITEANSIAFDSIIAATLDVTAGGSILHGTGFVDADTIDLDAQGGDIGASGNPIEINNAGSPVNLTATATGDIFINIQAASVVNLGPTTGDDITITSLADITTTDDITANGVLDITTNVLTNANDLTADIINIQSNPGSGLTIIGGTGTGTMNATTGINIVATGGDLNFFGDQTFNGDTVLNASAVPGASIIINPGANVIGNDSVTVITSNLVLNGNLQGNPLIIQNQFFTIANSLGDVTLSSDIVFQGTNFAILAAGNVVLGGLTTIDLSDVAGDGGSLFIAAGMAFTPATAGQVQDGVAYTLTGPSATGGSIVMPGTIIDLSAGNGDGGSFTAVAATGSTVGSGNITLGTITTDAVGGDAGSVQIIGEGGITTGAISAQGTTGTASVSLSVTRPTITGGPVVVTDGTVSGAGTFGLGANGNGVLNAGDIIADGDITIIGSGAMTINDLATTRTGDIAIAENASATLLVAPGSVLTTTEGDITIQNFGTNKKTAFIIIDDGTMIKGSGTTAGVGEVFIVFGALPVPPYLDRKKPPKNVSITETGGAGVFLGKKGIDVRKETNIALNALGRDLVFNLAEKKMSKKAIHVGSNVIITADPPWDTVPTASALLNTDRAMQVPTSSLTDTVADQTNAPIPGTADILSAPRPSVNTLAGLANLGSILAPQGSALMTDTVAHGAALTGTDSALNTIFGTAFDAATTYSGYIDATVVSHALPNAVKPIGAVQQLANDCAVYAPTQDMIVKTQNAEIAVAKNSVVLVIANAEGTSVYDLHDEKKQAVTIKAAGKKLALSPGFHATVSKTQRETYAEANMAECIMHRGVNREVTTNGGTIFTSQFAVNTAIEATPKLASLMTSKHPACARTAAKLMKTSAVLLYLTNSGEAFQQHQRPQLTAMN